MIDDSAIAELEALYQEYTSKSVRFLFAGVQPDVRSTMERAGFVDIVSKDHFCWDAISALQTLEKEIFSHQESSTLPA